ncbi:MAG: hypothetical protein GX197_05375 [Firmicutes bacterium]|nr:hypothetical protein [Bacillota bacterium]
MKFSRETVGLPVMHFDSGRELGKVREWLVDESGQVVIALVIEGGGWLPQKRIIPYREILSVGPDAIMVNAVGEYASGDPPSLAGQATRRVLGMRLLAAHGEELGIVEDILFDEESGRITGWRLSSGLIDDLLQGRTVLQEPLQLTMGEDALIINDVIFQRNELQE